MTFYQFTELQDFASLKQPVEEFCSARGIRGSILLAAEGINSTVSGRLEALKELITFLNSADVFGATFSINNQKFSVNDSPEHPFPRLKVKLKREIVTLGRPEADPRVQVGAYVKPQEWNEIISDPEVVLIDTRNTYETDIGTFQNALDLRTNSFREFPEKVLEALDPRKHKKVAMFCTGGIRCEKATSFMKAVGFEEVYHLEGGILKYLEEVPTERSLWKGECFVFDNRVSVNHELKPGDYDLCHACRHPLSKKDMASELYEHGVSCPHCHDNKTEDDRKRFAERERQIALAAARGKNHLGQAR